MATEVSPLNGTWPVNSSYNTIPVAYRSVRGSAAWPSICSGARYWTVPVTVPGAWLMRESAKARARPKSPTFGSPSEDRIRMFSGLMSRWTMPCACASSRAARTLVTTSTACAGWRLPSRIRMARRFGPRMNSMTMKYVPWVSPQSWTATMFGCDSMAAERASRRNRSMNPESSASEVCSIFSATSRSSTESWARYTSPIPPAAMRARIWYRPSTVVSIITPRRGAGLEAIVGADGGSDTEGWKDIDDVGGPGLPGRLRSNRARGRGGEARPRRSGVLATGPADQAGSGPVSPLGRGGRPRRPGRLRAAGPAPAPGVVRERGPAGGGGRAGGPRPGRGSPGIGRVVAGAGASGPDAAGRCRGARGHAPRPGALAGRATERDPVRLLLPRRPVPDPAGEQGRLRLVPAGLAHGSRVDARGGGGGLGDRPVCGVRRCLPPAPGRELRPVPTLGDVGGVGVRGAPDRHRRVVVDPEVRLEEGAAGGAGGPGPAGLIRAGTIGRKTKETGELGRNRAERPDAMLRRPANRPGNAGKGDRAARAALFVPMATTEERTHTDPLVIAGRTFGSRLIVGTGKFGSFEVMRHALEASGTEMVTVALRRVDLEATGGPDILEVH